MRSWRSSFVAALILALTVSSAYAFHAFPSVQTDKYRTQESAMRAHTKTAVSEKLPIMEKIVMMVIQQDEAAIEKTLVNGLASGELAALPLGTKVFWVKGVNDTIMAIRPQGSDKVYYAVRVFFETIQPGGDQK